MHRQPRPHKRVRLKQEIVFILDQDYDFARRLSTLMTQSKKRRITAYIAINSRQALELLSKDEFPDLIILEDSFPKEATLNAALSGQTLLLKSKRPKAFKKNLLVQGMRQEEMLKLIENALKRASPGGISTKPLILVYSFSPRVRYQWLKAFIKLQGTLGHPLYYFPFLPSYLVSLPLKFTPGPELSSLLLLLRSGAPADYQGLGPCFELQEDSYYALRTGGHADDLAEAGIEIQRQVTSLFRKFIRTRHEPSLGVMECSNIPFRDLRKLLTFADIFVAEIPKGNDYASRSGRCELNLTLNQMPASVHFMELNPYQIEPIIRRRA